MNKSAVRRNAHAGFLFGEPEDFYAVPEFAGSAESPLNESLLAFKSNLHSAIQIANIPYELAHGAVLRQRFHSLLTAERILNVKHMENGERDEEGEARAREIARKRMSEELRREEIIALHAEETLNRLDEHLSIGGFALSAEELLRQVLIVAWGAFESFVSDILRKTLNSRGELIFRMNENSRFREITSGSTIINHIKTNGFDISNCMGDIFIDKYRIDSIEKMREVCSILLGSKEFDQILNGSKYWMIYQQRNLIVHRRGIVDKWFQENTSSIEPLGSQIKFDSSYIEEVLISLRDAGVALYRAANRALGGS
ncbi:hypothetical protein ABGN05_07650 [Aquibium sp. LZ166]|uniref:RiboL-PSP-HEPN domain-containing protein n=1 Tax=Aquibium pacificus TaxID=3153579 RepID=A0ABV3SFJ5_9HYPH